MSKKEIVINITNLTVHVGASQGMSLPAIIGALIHRAVTEQTDAEDTPTTGADSTPAHSPVETKHYTDGSSATGVAPLPDLSPAQQEAGSGTPPVALTHDNVLSVLRGDPRYTKRTLEAVAKVFSDEERSVVADMLHDLVVNGKVRTYRRRADGATLYEAVGAAPVATQAEAATTTAATDTPAITGEAIFDFLKSSSEYRQRTIGAIAKHFGVSADDAALQSKLDELVDNDVVETRTRRADGATLYSAA